MKFVVEINDFYLDEDRDIEPALKQYVIREVIEQIGKRIDEKVKKQIEVDVAKSVEKTMFQQITATIKNILRDGKIKSRNSSQEVTMEEYIRECLNYHGGWQSFDDTIKKLAKQYADELKQRYDLLFAAQIVAKMSDHGLLKDDAIKKLLEKNK